MTRRIRTNGYRGPLTYFLYLPPGEYTVTGAQMDLSAKTIPTELADYLVKSGQCEELEPAADPESEAIEEAPVEEVIPEATGGMDTSHKTRSSRKRS